MPKNGGIFREELLRGHRFAQVVGRRFVQAGIHAEVTAPSFARSEKERERFTRTDVDVVVWGRGQRQVIEVKSRRIRFSGPDDWPAAFDPAFVDTVAGWQAKKHRPVAVVLISQLTLGIAVIPASTRPFWQIVRKRDRRRDLTVVEYACPAEHLRSFAELCAWLKQ